MDKYNIVNDGFCGPTYGKAPWDVVKLLKTGLDPSRRAPPPIPDFLILRYCTAPYNNPYIKLWWPTTVQRYGVWITQNQCMDDRSHHSYCGNSETVCTVEYCTVDFMANANVSILVRPMSVLKRSRYYGVSFSRGSHSIESAWELFRIESSTLFRPR